MGVQDVMASMDWSATPVGPRGSWPPILDSLVRVLLASRFPMWMGWGPDLTFFYNDAYRRDTLGVKHPWALGRPAQEVWQEIWPDIGPRIEAGRRGEATWDQALLLFLERSGYREETYHTFSYSPITEGDGSVAGVLCVVTEETDRVIGARRLGTLRQLASDLSGARREGEVLDVVAGRLAENPFDLPYALVYLLDGSGGGRLACAAGAPPGDAVAPDHLDSSSAGSWPLAEMLARNATVVVDDVVERFGGAPRGAWDVPSPAALMVPISQQGQPDPAGFLVVGANPYRPVDEDVVGFVELLAGQVAAGVASARAYEAERRRAEALAELDRAKTEFFSNVSHEFRTPLTLILGPAEDALNDDLVALPVEHEVRLRVIRRNARRLRRLVNDMLDFARIEGGRLRAETLPTDLADLTRDVALSFAPAIERAGLRLVIDCPPLPRPVHVDRDMWEKIVLNLLSNALKFTLDGEIRVSLADRGDAVQLAVADTGVGIASDHLAQLFQRFYRAPRAEARSQEGTGIGLALVHELVQLHGGQVSVTSAEGSGATFNVQVPYGTHATGTASMRADSARQAYLDEALQWLPGATDEELGGRRARAGRTADATVLVVDDNPDMRRYVARILEPFWDVTTAADGAAALVAVRRRRPNLILTDVMMPGLDGFALLAALRRDPQTATIPVVFLSARAGEEAAVEGLDAGADDYLVKPFSALELLARVRSHLELAAMRNQDAAWRTALVESLDEAVLVMDASGTVVEANPAFERILGFPRSGVPYKPPFPWLRDLPDDQPRGDLVELLARILREGRYRGTEEVRHRDGRAVYVEGSVESVVMGGEPRFVVTFRDVTAERLSAERESALAGLGIRLAEAVDVDEVRRGGLDELRRVFHGARAGVQTSPADHDRGLGMEPECDGAAAREHEGRTPPGPLAVAVARARRQQRVVEATTADDADGTPVGMAAPLDPVGGAGVVWVEFDRPRRVSAEERSLFGVLCGYFGQALRRAQLFDDSRTVATAMQRSILGPTDVPDGMAVRYLPAVQPLEVGGDWYDALELPGNRIALVVGDCVGRGLPAATVMGQLRSACRALLVQARTAAEVVGALDAFAERIPGASCTTIFCGILHLDTFTLRYCSAGHIPGVLASPDGDVSLLHQDRSVPLGVAPGIERSISEVELPPGASVLVCTDGLVERRHESLDTGLARLADAVREGRHLTPEPLADAVMAALVPDSGQEDDVAMVVFRRRVGPPGDFDIVLAADPAELAALRRRLGTWLRDVGAAHSLASDVLIASGEAVANAMEHACDFDRLRTVRVSASCDGSVVDVLVRDVGRWRPARRESDERGRGLQIMEGLMDEVRVTRGPGGTDVHLRKELRDGD